LREELLRQRRDVLNQLVRQATAHSAAQVLPLRDIQRTIPADVALLLWLDVGRVGEHRACIVRGSGPPRWVSLPGSGKDGAWTEADRLLPDRLYRLLVDPTAGSDRERNDLLAELRQQRLGPLRAHLAGVKHLFVVPTGWAAFVPIE